MRMFFKILIGIGGLVILLFAQCRKKTKTNDISGWLEKEYPNRFEVLDTYTKDVIGNLSFSVKESIVAEKSNPMVQAHFRWDKRVKGLTLSKKIVDNAFFYAHQNYKDASSLYKTIEANGLKDMAVSIKYGKARVLIFAEPTPEHRQMSLEILEKCFVQWQKGTEYEIIISYHEPLEKDKEFKEIVPLIYWMQSTPEFNQNMLYSTRCPANQRFVAQEAAKTWHYNTVSNRFKALTELAQKEVDTWASKHIKRPVTMFEIEAESKVNEQTNIVALKMPFAYQPDPEQKTSEYISSDGYIAMDFHIEKKVIIGNIKLIHE